mmetsp:Transcript_88809/g.240198  ORF Transcript_88809/g.240198 Transcript_88809/m.240198 type:complete len:93 (+) Transcript_88809:378-656(+)
MEKNLDVAQKNLLATVYNVVDQENLSDGSWYDRPEDSALPFAARRCPQGDALETQWVSTMAREAMKLDLACSMRSMSCERRHRQGSRQGLRH